MRGITGVVGFAAAVALAGGLVARGGEPLRAPYPEALDRGAAPAPLAPSDREAYEAYEAQLQELLLRARHRQPGSTAVARRAEAPATIAGPMAGAFAGPTAGPIARPIAGSPALASASSPATTPTATAGAPRAAPLTIRLSGSADTPTGCLFFQPGADQTTAADCMGCHGMSRTHPVDFDYATAAAGKLGFYRPVEEVLRRGVVLPNGQVKCVTCHDVKSPWADKIALPPGATPTPAVNLARPETYEPSRTQLAQTVRLPAGAAVSPTPLCQSCHTYGD